MPSSNVSVGSSSSSSQRSGGRRRSSAPPPPPSSYWDGWKQSLNDTLSDMSSWMLGDDTGISSKIVLTIPPVDDGRRRQQVMGIGGGGRNITPYNMRTTSVAAIRSSTRGGGGGSGGIATPSSGHHAGGYYYHNKYHPHYVSMTPTNYSAPPPKRLQCHGMTLLELQGRAYVQSIQPGSLAEYEGIQLGDCLHLARVEISPSSTTKFQSSTINDEKSGYRTSFRQLYYLLQKAIEHPNPTAGNNDPMMLSGTLDTTNAKNGLGCGAGGVPLTIQCNKPKRGGGGGGSSSSSSSKKGGGNISPSRANSLSAAANPQSPSSGGDDNNNNHANNTEEQERQQQNNNKYQWVLVFCRSSPRKPNTTLWPHFRLDEECLHWTALISPNTLPPFKSVGSTTTTTTTLTTTTTTTTKKNSNSNNSNKSLQQQQQQNKNNQTTNKISGLAFVTCHKLSAGISCVYGSGFVLARLEDGTWSAPCAVGLWGVGLGLQVGIERTHLAFVLETPQALQEFCTVGSVTIGAHTTANPATTVPIDNDVSSPTKKSKTKKSSSSSTTTNNNNNTPSSSPSSFSGLFCGGSNTTTNDSTYEHDFNNDDDDADNNIVVGPFCEYNSTTYTTSGANDYQTPSNAYYKNLQDHFTAMERDPTDPAAALSRSPAATAHQQAPGTTDSSTSTSSSHESTESSSNSDSYKKDNKKSSSSSQNSNNNQPSSTSSNGIRAYVQNSQGLYVGISLEGSKLFARDDVNARVYQIHHNPSLTSKTDIPTALSTAEKANDLSSTKVTTDVILSGKVPAPNEVQPLYKKLYHLEWEQALQEYPFNRRKKNRQQQQQEPDDDEHEDILDCPSSMSWNAREPPTNIPLSCSSSLSWNASQPASSSNKNGGGANNSDNNSNADNTQDNKEQEEEYKAIMDLLQGGIPCSNYTKLAWLFTPAEKNQSLQIGFLIQPSANPTGAAANSNNNNKSSSPTSPPISRTNTGSVAGGTKGDIDTVVSEDVTMDSAIVDIWQGVTVSTAGRKTIVTTATNNTNTSSTPPAAHKDIELSSIHSTSLIDVVSMTLQKKSAIKPTICIKSCKRKAPLLLEISCDDGDEDVATLIFHGLILLLERETSRLGIRGGSNTSNKKHISFPSSSPPGLMTNAPSNDEDDNNVDPTHVQWSILPGRSYLRQIANQGSTPKYVHGQLLVRDLSKNVRLPLPWNITRELLLDTHSEVVIRAWGSGDAHYTMKKTNWTFPPATPREQESSSLTESQLIATGSMRGAHRTWSFEPKNAAGAATMIRLSETHIVDADDSEQMTIQIQERLPRRGFSIKVKLIVRPFSDDSCEASVIAEVRPVGRNMSNPTMVHRAFLVVIDELKTRYDTFLWSSFNQIAQEQYPDSISTNHHLRTSPRRATRSSGSTDRPHLEEKKDDSDSINIQDMFQENASLAKMDSKDARRSTDDRRPTPRGSKDRYNKSSIPNNKKGAIAEDTFEDDEAEGPVMIEVKPLPKIRLSLMPSPKEEDEFKLDENGDPIKKSKKGSSKRKSSSPRKKSSSRRSSSRKSF